jgi:hypothetical protein
MGRTAARSSTGRARPGAGPSRGCNAPQGPPGCVVIAKRWGVARPGAWLGRYRRVSKDDAYAGESSEAFISIAMSRRMLRRLVRSPAVVPSCFPNTL